jgi:hypothetical protein
LYYQNYQNELHFQLTSEQSENELCDYVTRKPLSNGQTDPDFPAKRAEAFTIQRNVMCESMRYQRSLISVETI